jgi:hypothetical protein
MPMEKDAGPDTISLEEEAAPWASTELHDVFDPAVRVMLSWRDLEAAVELGAVVPAQAHALWASWASQGSPQRVTQPAPAPAAAAKPVPIELLMPPAPPERSGSSPGVLLGFTLAAALAGALLSYAFFAI